jgi:hypothetical protein
VPDQSATVDAATVDAATVNVATVDAAAGRQPGTHHTRRADGQHRLRAGDAHLVAVHG